MCVHSLRDHSGCSQAIIHISSYLILLPDALCTCIQLNILATEQTSAHTAKRFTHDTRLYSVQDKD